MVGDCGTVARLWPHFAAISSGLPAWLVLCERVPLFGVPDLARDDIRGQVLCRLWPGSNEADIRRAGGEQPMFEFGDLFQWDRFITPTIIKTFYWLVIALIVLFGLSGIFSGLAAMAISPFGGFILLLSSIASVVVGVVFSRIAAEFILIVFRINEHLGAIRDQGQMR
jgi:predicted membrane metal-binding protein